MVPLPSEGRTRVVIEDVSPVVDGGRFPVKCTIGERIRVEAAIFADGHDSVSCVVLHKFADEAEWHSLPMTALGNDIWRAEFQVSRLGRYSYTIEGWVDHFKTWQADLKKRIAAAQDLSADLIIGSQFIAQAAIRASGNDAKRLKTWAAAVASGDTDTAQSEELFATMLAWPDPSLATRCERELTLWVEPPRARFSTWYELFPRSASPDPRRHGTFKDCVARLSYIAGMGFDVVYLPPIHPIGKRFRKGKNNTPTAHPEDPGSPWAIGDETGGHTALHPELGTFDDFQLLLAEAQRLGLDVALDIAFQCSPDHPWVREHPEWFRKRPDGSIQYAENPPKKYQDIYPVDFETGQWRELWVALKAVIEFWVGQGIRFFRVDNPHTKALPFWEWAIESIKGKHPEVIFLAEAFTRPHLMQRLAKLGFTQSYTYFTWRNTKRELTDYFRQLSQPPLRHYFRGSLWPNTPDILSETLQVGGRPAFMMRLLLAATLGANYGIYGPVFELAENTPREPGSEEYLNSEKYEVRYWDLNSQPSLKDFVARVNRIRHENTALQNDHSLVFHETDNQNLICYSKAAEGLANMVIVVVNLDWAHAQAGWITLDLDALGLGRSHSFEVHDLLSGSRFLWQGPRNYVELTPLSLPGHILRVRRWARTERDFDYFL
ncbi:MAG TPA: alpha-1,4-glucan--maltose-1-phosphate maltosyltransferase [Bryobacteraceae bacterium]|nr:alpha-1,4-glucan--maltose-1-phosphate maltosyltransferase [Bryobacteraceae bacterium]